MEIYLKNKKGELKETCMRDLIAESLKEHFKNYVETGSYDDGSGEWVELTQEKENVQVTIVVQFEGTNSITDFNVYTAPIERVVKEDQQVKII